MDIIESISPQFGSQVVDCDEQDIGRILDSWILAGKGCRASQTPKRYAVEQENFHRKSWEYIKNLSIVQDKDKFVLAYHLNPTRQRNTKNAEENSQIAYNVKVSQLPKLILADDQSGNKRS